MKPRLLLVDDEPFVLASLTDLLRRRFDIMTATSGAAGLLRLANDGPFTVLVSDYSMPGMDGATFLAHARVAAPDTVRILLTGRVDVDGAIAAVNEGNVFRLLLKPCPPERLFKVLDDAVEQARLITADHHLIERKLEMMSESLVRTERLASLGTMAGAIGHELNNVLTVYAAALSFVRDNAADGRPAATEDLVLMERVRDQLTSHARNLLNLGRPPHSEPRREADLLDVTSRTIDMLRNAGLLKRFHLRLDLGTQPIPVAMAPVELEQVLVNLLKNAADALLETTREHAEIHVRLSADTDAGLARLLIADNAAGIPESRLALLFEPYYTTKPPDRGTGLGLFVVRQIARAAGGDVEVESEVGIGTKVTVTCRLAQAPPTDRPGTVGASDAIRTPAAGSQKASSCTN